MYLIEYEISPHSICDNMERFGVKLSLCAQLLYFKQNQSTVYIVQIISV